MKYRWIAVPVSLTLLLVFILFVPVVPLPGDGSMTVCGPKGCVHVDQYESISYAYGGWGAVFQTGVNWYRLDGWICSCPPSMLNCCVPSLGWLIGPGVAVLFLADLLSIAIIFRRLSEGLGWTVQQTV